MINFLTNWIQQIVIAVILVSVFELIIPNGNLKKYIKIVLGIYVIYCIISPFVDSSSLYKLEEKDLENYIKTDSNETAKNQESMDLRLQKIYIEELEKDVESKINEYGYKVNKIDIDANLNQESPNPGIHKINLVLSSNDNNIQKIEIGKNKENETQENEKIEEIKQNLANYYEINKDVINIKLK